ncbi:hypothetical protein PSN45_000719 [Yamadazyma tenuis]|uniref:K Homology domain-containing protein n=1 Tax=Candida tenuis (strain ATCC 10573 / BCRC 21748 / CBS 615 / JCM 9827 / NBRC 10315 / NRRL Y-1498 / VKM Y-70) TaxID=590646 RepID=G3BA41_CANTC|nr:uncharacterized protein CANTEDRAFT_135940 [Yamadazyma tenuis ATCC 10573]EGV62005.1 hypothetical protein CANTEDRAFT_135940 [Yamadazyma tenuis ATCC 10573]WEJ93257.1 hypothetical protein PSN45_000719 [Yamadazyma tenuis]
MSTPAEIIAARIAAQANKASQEDYNDYSDSDVDDGVSSLTASIPSLTDESAFPTLGGGKKPNTTASVGASWGLGGSATASKSPSIGSNGKFKSSTIQEAFSLDADDQLNMDRPEFIKILTTVKAETKTSIECTTSQHTKRRTFLITGKPEDVKLAKRLVIKKLTKPVSTSFEVPAKLRAKIIGPQGKVLRPIISESEVKIEIGAEETFVDGDASNDDIFNKVITIVIYGDTEGCKLAKGRILDIVKDETKNLSIKISVDETVKPFAAKFLQDFIDEQFKELDILVPEFKSSKNVITIIGERELALSAKDEINSKLAQLASKLVIEDVPIPKLKHQFLPIDQILEEENVLIKLLGTGVQFIGEKAKIPVAKEKARQTTSQYKIEVLDMSKAHKGNIPHVSAVAEFLKVQGFFNQVGLKHGVVVNAPSKSVLDTATITSIPIEFVVNSAEVSDENIKAAKKEVVSTVNKLAPDSVKVIDDIDSFLISKVPSAIDSLVKENNITYVILNNRISLFTNDSSVQDSEDFEFEDTSKINEAFESVDAALNSLRELKSDLETVVLEVPGSIQKFVSGRGNTTLNAIIGEVEPHSVAVKLNFDGEIQSEDKLHIHGLKSQVASVQKSIERVINDAKEYGDKYVSTVSIPSTTLSRLIGKNGQFLNSLVNEFGVRIDVAEEEDQKENKKTEIALTGIKKNVESCQAKIVSLSKKWADETLVRIKIESQYHRRLIGANGKFINRLQDKYGVRIRFPSAIELSSNSPDAPKTKDEVTIKGPSKAVAGAKDELEEFYRFEKENGFEQTIEISTKVIPRVIGKSGETINDIADATGVEYQFKRDNVKEEETGVVEVKLTGSKSALKEAISRIQSIVDEAENFVSIDVEVDSKYHRDIIGQNGSKMREIISIAGGDSLPPYKYHKLLNLPNAGSGSNLVNSQGPKEIVNKIVSQLNDLVALKEASVLIEVEVPKEKQRFLVGPSGSTRQALEKEFGVSIEVPRQNDDSAVVKVSGLPEQIEAAKLKIQELTKDDWNDSIDIPENLHWFVSEGGQVFRTLRSNFNVDVGHDNLTRKASKLSNASFPKVPEDSLPTDDDKVKFIIQEREVVDGANIIPWRLKGEKENTVKALKFLQHRLQLAQEADHCAWFYSSKPSSFSKVIGPGGSTVKKIREKSKSQITIPRASDQNSNYIYLVGSKDNLEVAKGLIETLL